MIGLTASDGFNTVTVTTTPFEVPRKPCLAMVLAPEDGTHFPAGGNHPARGSRRPGRRVEHRDPGGRGIGVGTSEWKCGVCQMSPGLEETPDGVNPVS